ncbi:14008_t:CDS:2 [Acaulospora morrowiae]|uniref:14008_t:CDS:1 n=1 Tax=Acaulospora morrowiae TaxID=94023 RepID=A0A9N9F7I0_9GLOM|nr:14008_t:CDS:2 [Acaulospora morrowiae]
MSEQKYPGYKELTSYLTRHKNRSLWSFLILYRDAIVATTPEDSCEKDLDNLWAGRFTQEITKFDTTLGNKVCFFIFCEVRATLLLIICLAWRTTEYDHLVSTPSPLFRRFNFVVDKGLLISEVDPERRRRAKDFDDYWDSIISECKTFILYSANVDDSSADFSLDTSSDSGKPKARKVVRTKGALPSRIRGNNLRDIERIRYNRVTNTAITLTTFILAFTITTTIVISPIITAANTTFSTATTITVTSTITLYRFL